MLAGFIFRERRVAQPVVDFSLFHNRLFTASLISSFLCFLALFAVMFLMPFYLEELLALPVQVAGILMTGGAGVHCGGGADQRLAVGPLRLQVSQFPGPGNLLPGALVPQPSGCTESTTFDIVWPLLVTGSGQALFQPPNNNAILSSVPPERVGIASGFLSTVRVLGQSASVALSGAIFTALGGRPGRVRL